MNQSEALEALKSSEYLDGVPESQLSFLIEKGEIRSYEKGDPVFVPDEAADHLLIVLKGLFKLYINRNGNYSEVGECEKGYITGVLPYSRMVKAVARGEAKEPTEVLHVYREHFDTMIKQHHELVTALVHFMTSRVRDFSQRRSNEEKLAALGKLSAGLAHELNNPASAIVRSSQELKKHLSSVPEKFKQTMSLNVTDDEVDAVNELMHEKISAGIQSMSLMAKTELEDDIAEWLEEHGAEDGYDMAENFVDYGFSVDDLEKFEQILPEHKLMTVLHWVNSNLTTERMVSEIQESSTRIADLVKSVKAYTHMDQAPTKEKVDLRIGIRNTITMLNHKTKRQQIEISEDFPSDFPNVEVYVSELNQVWTNLLDNAIDALEGQENQKITIRGLSDDRYVRIQIIDNGPGIPEEIKNKIFDPFFTTKGQGKGTGLGLDVVQRIVQHNNGIVKLESRPGQTQFEICFAVNS